MSVSVRRRVGVHGHNAPSLGSLAWVCSQQNDETCKNVCTAEHGGRLTAPWRFVWRGTRFPLISVEIPYVAIHINNLYALCLWVACRTFLQKSIQYFTKYVLLREVFETSERCSNFERGCPYCKIENVCISANVRIAVSFCFLGGLTRHRKGTALFSLVRAWNTQK